MRTQSIRRGIVIAATAAGLWALGAAAAQADEPSSSGGALGAVTRGVTRDAQHTVHHTVRGAVAHTVNGTVKHTVNGTVKPALRGNVPQAVRGTGETVSATVAGTAKTVRGTVHHGLPRTAAAVGGAGDALRTSAGKAVTHATQEAGKAVPQPSALPAGAQLADAVSRVPAKAAAPVAQGLPEDLNIGVPQLIPGVPSIGIVPLSLPALPVPALPITF